MGANIIHIIAFNTPYPANYGGVIDVFYKIKWLHALGVSIILHCYSHDRAESTELERLCKEVHYYPRKVGFAYNLSIKPYNIIGRSSQALLKRLQADQAPILFEGLHTCAWLNHPSLRGRRKIVRCCNVEHDYYHAIARASHTFVAKLFHHIEGIKFRYFETILRYATDILAVSETDANHFRVAYPQVSTHFMPCFHRHDSLQTSRGHGSFVLYHGKLSVAENEEAALWLIEKVFAQIDYPCLIAGMNPSERLINQIKRYSHIKIIANPDDATMEQLIADAQVHILWTHQPTGLKLKLLNCLFAGKHIVANEAMLCGSGLRALCHVANSEEEAKKMCEQLLSTPFDIDEQAKRTERLFPLFFPQLQAQRLVEIICSTEA